MGQKASLAIFLSSLCTFMLSFAEVLKSHNDWHYFSTTAGVAHIIILTATFIGTIGGALWTNPPRSKNSRAEDQISTTTLEEIKKEDESRGH